METHGHLKAVLGYRLGIVSGMLDYLLYERNMTYNGLSKQRTFIEGHRFWVSPIV